MKIKLIGGRSTGGSITILSLNYSAQARYLEDGSIDVDLHGVPYLTIFFYRHPKLPIPRILKMVLFFLAQIPKKKLLTYAGYASLYFVTKFVLGLMWPAEEETITRPEPFTYWSHMIQFAIIGLILVYIRIWVAKNHGAEHMAIDAFKGWKIPTVDEIKKESPINDHCGGRFLFPIIVFSLLADLVVFRFNTPPLVTFLVAIEIVLWIDTLIGWNKIPVSKQASRLLQKHITTEIPSGRELSLAHAALSKLVYHERRMAVLK